MHTPTVLGLLRRAALLLFCAAGLACTGSAKSAACPGLQGTFLQLTEARAKRPPGDWRLLIDQMRSLGLRDLFLQWTVVDRKAFFRTAGFTTPADNPLPLILQLAARSGMRVWVGLAMDTRYWDQIKQGPDLLRGYFQRRLRDASGFVGDLNAAIGKTPFAGWYIPDEIDDRTWLDPEKRSILEKYLADTSRLLKAERPGSKVAISGFSNSFADPAQLAAFWGEVIRTAGIDLLLFQDGVGEGKVALEDISLYYQPLNRAALSADARLGAVVELFSLMADGRRVPAMISRIREQMVVAGRLTSFPLVAFSVPDYMSSFAGPQAGQLMSSYLSGQKGCRG